MSMSDRSGKVTSSGLSGSEKSTLGFIKGSPGKPSAISSASGSGGAHFNMSSARAQFAEKRGMSYAVRNDSHYDDDDDAELTPTEKRARLEDFQNSTKRGKCLVNCIYGFQILFFPVIFPILTAYVYFYNEEVNDDDDVHITSSGVELDKLTFQRDPQKTVGHKGFGFAKFGKALTNVRFKKAIKSVGYKNKEENEEGKTSFKRLSFRSITKRMVDVGLRDDENDTKLNLERLSGQRASQMQREDEEDFGNSDIDKPALGPEKKKPERGLNDPIASSLGSVAPVSTGGGTPTSKLGGMIAVSKTATKKKGDSSKSDSNSVSEGYSSSGGLTVDTTSPSSALRPQPQAGLALVSGAFGIHPKSKTITATTDATATNGSNLFTPPGNTKKISPSHSSGRVSTGNVNYENPESPLPTLMTIPVGISPDFFRKNKIKGPSVKSLMKSGSPKRGLF
jgi:hypothetical protein